MTATINKLSNELELLLSDIAFSGIRNASPSILQKLEHLKLLMEELSMSEGIELTHRFISSLHAYHRKETSVDAPVNNLCTLEFYVRTVIGNSR